MNNGAIETAYAGRLFRSRLEARWAVFFDSLGIHWQYEPQGFEAVDGSRYLPDFYLPDLQTWVEVKGDPNGLRAQRQRICSVLSGARSPIPYFTGSYEVQPSGEACNGLLVLGEFPRDSSILVAHQLIRHSAADGQDQLMLSWACFVPLVRGAVGLLAIGPGLLPQLLDLDDRELGDDDDPGWTVASRCVNGVHNFEQITRAYRDGGFARFEHGQRGRA